MLPRGAYEPGKHSRALPSPGQKEPAEQRCTSSVVVAVTTVTLRMLSVALALLYAYFPLVSRTIDR